MNLKVGKQFRGFIIDRASVDDKKRTVELSFSSEEPVERWWGMEILDHKKSSVNLRRLKRGGALLIDHDMKNQVGVIEEVTVDEADLKGRASVRFGRSAKAEEIFQDVLDGIRSNVSVGYQIDEVVLEKEEKNKPSTYRVTHWEPYEISLVSVPADISVGVGRSDEDGKEIDVKLNKYPDVKPKEERKMEKCPKCAANMVDGKCPACEAQREIEAKTGKEVAKFDAAEHERGRISAIEKFAKINNIDDRTKDEWVRQGYTLEQVANDILKIKEQRDRVTPKTQIGMTEMETRRFSLVKAIIASKDQDWRNAQFELECSRAVAQRIGKVVDPNKFYVPFEVLERPVDLSGVRKMTGQRDISVASGGGAYLVSTDNIGFIEILRNRSVAFRMGVTRLTGLMGNVTIPKQTGAATAYWLSAETTQIGETQQTFVQVALTPKNVGAYTEISRQLLLQSSPAVEGIVSDDLARVVAIAADLAVLNGSGSAGQPQGIIGTGGIGGVTGGSLAYAGVLEFQADVAASNVVPLRGGYVGTPAVAAVLMAEMKVANDYSPCWEGNIWDGSMVGFPAMSSMQLPTANLIFGDWSQIVVGEWGVLEVEVNPYANFQAGIIGIRAIYSMDVGVRYAAAFSLATGVS